MYVLIKLSEEDILEQVDKIIENYTCPIKLQEEISAKNAEMDGGNYE